MLPVHGGSFPLFMICIINLRRLHPLVRIIADNESIQSCVLNYGDIIPTEG